MPGLAAPLVKAEVGEDEPDYGGPEEEAPKAEPQAGPPRRAAADYGDLLADDGPGPPAKEELDPTRPIGRRRPEGIYVRGVQRLTRTHMAELFEVKKLPLFKWVEWVADDEAVCVWDDPKDANVALQGVQAGFELTANDVETPGPGLWRAQRFMLDFRQATEEDRPSVDFRKKHRGGLQVREFRFWEAMKDFSHNILDDQEEMLKHGPMPSGEDAFAAADFDDDAARRRRLRHGVRPGEDDGEEEIDLLRKMADLDKQILAKQELKEDGAPVSKANDTSLVANEAAADDEPRGEKRRTADSGTWGTWQHDDRWGGSGGRDDDDWGDGWGGAQKRRRQDGGGGGRGGRGGGRGGGDRRGGDGGGERGGGGGRGVDFEFAVDDTEKERRAKRTDRFKTK